VCLIIKFENAPLLMEKLGFVTLLREQAFRTIVEAHHHHECDSELRIELAPTESGPLTAVDNRRPGHDVKLHPHFNCHWQLFVLMCHEAG